MKGRRTGIGPLANSSPASRQGREKSSPPYSGGYASLHHRLISVAPPGREITSLSLPAVSQAPAPQRLTPILISKLKAIGLKAELLAIVKTMRMSRMTQGGADLSALP